MNRFLISATLAAAVAAVAALSTPAAAQQPVKIGFLAELSGQQAVFGQDQLDGFMLLVEGQGGKLGGVPVQVIREDSRLRPEVALQLAQKLIESDQVAIIAGITFSNVMMAISKPVTDRQVFLIGSLAAPSPLAGAGCSPYQFVTSLQVDSVAEAYGKYANDRGLKRMVLMAPNYQAGKDFINGFKRTFTGEVVDEVYTQLGQSDYSAEVTQLAAQKPDGVFAMYPGPMGISFVRQYSQAGLSKNVPLLTVGAIDASTLGALKGAALGVYNAHSWSPDIDNPANRKFIADFQARYGRQPGLAAAFSYDSAQLIDSALRKVHGNVADKTALRAALKAADFKSVRGDFAFGSNQFPVTDVLVQQVVNDDKRGIALKTVAVPLKKYVDSYAKQCAMK